MAGEAAVLAPIADAIAEQLEADEEQLGLWSEPVSAAGAAKLRLVPRGPGRPPGAKNKRTEATVAHLLQRYRDPRAVALERIQMHPADLAGVLGCTVFEAAQEQRLYMQAVFPFIHARITPEVIDNRQVIHLHLGGVEGGGGASGPGAVHVLEAGDYETVADGASAATRDGSEG